MPYDIYEIDPEYQLVNNQIDYENCKCLNCGEIYKVNEKDIYHIQQFCRKYCADAFLRSLK